MTPSLSAVVAAVRWLEPKDAAQAAGVAVKRLYRWAEHGELVLTFLPGGRRYRVAIGPAGVPVAPSSEAGRALLAEVGLCTAPGRPAPARRPGSRRRLARPRAG